MDERELWAAVLLRAVMDFTGARDVSKRERPVLQRAARLWFTSYSDHLGSFVWVCGELNLPPGRLRAKILTMEKTGSLVSPGTSGNSPVLSDNLIRLDTVISE